MASELTWPFAPFDAWRAAAEDRWGKYDPEAEDAAFEAVIEMIDEVDPRLYNRDRDLWEMVAEELMASWNAEDGFALTVEQAIGRARQERWRLRLVSRQTWTRRRHEPKVLQRTIRTSRPRGARSVRSRRCSNRRGSPSRKDGEPSEPVAGAVAA